MMFLSYILNEKTPTYGNRNRFVIEKKSSIKSGDIANDSFIHTTVHVGTHIDMPYHFYEDGQTISDFEPNFWISDKVLFFEIEPESLIIKHELFAKLHEVDVGAEYEILIVKTGACHSRDKKIFWEKNYGFSSEIADYLKEYFPNIRIFGFDSISISSFTSRKVGKEAHKRFLDPKNPILLLEDMDLKQVDKNTEIKKIIICPLRIAKSDALPCTVFAEVLDEY
ncbi:MAG: cyclase family protein [Methanosarcinales archaeon]|nr:cyclase family protein [Methanosarcinales archaeon]